jgi:hypothetical protein
MQIVEFLTGHIIPNWFQSFLRKPYLGRYAAKMEASHIRLSELAFPFDLIHQDEPYFQRLKEHFERSLGCPISSLPVRGLFTVVKRYLRLASPPLWEESERMEAEVRMSGSMFLVACYSLVLSAMAIVRYWTISDFLASWFVVSFIAGIGLLGGFFYLRHREVSYTYINALLVLDDRQRVVAATKDSEKAAAAVVNA